MDASIVIVAYNEEKYLPALLKSLMNQTENGFETIVVDSNSTDNTGQIANGYKHRIKNFKYLKLDAAKGPAYARNCGVALAQYEQLIFLDADTMLKPDFIEQINHELARKKADIASCPIRISEKGLLSAFGALFMNSFMIVLKPFYSSGYGACLISNKTTHQILGGFREDLGVCEDCNYIKRARRIHGLNYRILSPYFYTSDRRTKTEGEVNFLLKYIKIHLYRMFTGKELMKGEISYKYGQF